MGARPTLKSSHNNKRKPLQIAEGTGMGSLWCIVSIKIEYDVWRSCSHDIDFKSITVAGTICEPEYPAHISSTCLHTSVRFHPLHQKSVFETSCIKRSSSDKPKKVPGYESYKYLLYSITGVCLVLVWFSMITMAVPHGISRYHSHVWSYAHYSLSISSVSVFGMSQVKCRTITNMCHNASRSR